MTRAAKERELNTRKVVDDDDFVEQKGENIQDFINTLDLSLTDEQKRYVAMLKKKMKGGARSCKSPYRDAVKPEDIVPDGLLLPQIAENADEIIDWALSHIPRRKSLLHMFAYYFIELELKLLQELVLVVREQRED